MIFDTDILYHSINNDIVIYTVIVLGVLGVQFVFQITIYR